MIRHLATIRRILLAAFLLVSLTPSLLLTVLAFERTRSAMLNEIEGAVARQAAAMSADVDRALSERLLNATTWNHLEVMQDLRLDDVDKRLSQFLAEVKHRYGDVYRDLHAVSPQGHIVASSSAARIGQPFPSAAPWQTVRLGDETVTLDEPFSDAAGEGLMLRSDIGSPFVTGTIGQLVLEVNWTQIQQLIQQAGAGGRKALVLDEAGALVLASDNLLTHGLHPGQLLPDWRTAAPLGGAVHRAGLPLMDDDVVAGYARSPGFGRFQGFGWTYLLVQSHDEALAPVRRMAWIFAGLMAAIAVAAVLLSLWIADAIARPVIALTAFTRRFVQPGQAPEIPPEGPGEIGELNRSFVRMVEDLQRSQQTLTQASKLAALGEVTALLAHEVRTPLGILRSSVQMLASEKQMSAEGRELLRIVDAETQRLSRLVSSMLDSARTRAPQRQTTDVHGLIAHVAALLAAQLRDRGVSLKLAAQARHPVLSCDPEQITQVLLNLVMNAMQILPHGGQIEVHSRDAENRLSIEVGDNGPGIPMEQRTDIFEPFVFKREGGIGLGLAVVHQIIRAHGGDIVVDTSPLGGALFRFWLPRSNPEPA